MIWEKFSNKAIELLAQFMNFMEYCCCNWQIMNLKDENLLFIIMIFFFF